MKTRPRNPLLRYKEKKAADGTRVIIIEDSWKERISRHVRRKRDGQLYFSSRVAALAHKDTRMTAMIERNCNGEIIFVFTPMGTENFEWADDHTWDYGYGDVDKYVKRVEQILYDEYMHSLKLGITIPSINIIYKNRSAFIQVKKFVEFFKIFESMNYTQKIAEFTPINTFYEEMYAPMYKDHFQLNTTYKNPPFLASNSFSRHLSLHNELYSKFLGLEITKLPNKEMNYKRIGYIRYNPQLKDPKFNFDEMNNRSDLAIYKINDITHPRVILHYHPGWVQKAYIIKCKTDGITYASMRDVLKTYAVPKYMIFACCTGVIEAISIPELGYDVEFEFGKYADLDAEYHAEWLLQRYSQGGIGQANKRAVFEMVSNTHFDSIADAARKLNIPRSYINYSLKNKCIVEFINPILQTSGGLPVGVDYKFIDIESDEYDEMLLADYTEYQKMVDA